MYSLSSTSFFGVRTLLSLALEMSLFVKHYEVSRGRLLDVILLILVSRHRNLKVRINQSSRISGKIVTIVASMVYFHLSSFHSLSSTWSVSLVMAPPDMHHIVRRDWGERNRMDVGSSLPAGSNCRCNVTKIDKDKNILVFIAWTIILSGKE